MIRDVNKRLSNVVLDTLPDIEEYKNILIKENNSCFNASIVLDNDPEYIPDLSMFDVMNGHYIIDMKGKTRLHGMPKRIVGALHIRNHRIVENIEEYVLNDYNIHVCNIPHSLYSGPPFPRYIYEEYGYNTHIYKEHFVRKVKNIKELSKNKLYYTLMYMYFNINYG